MLYQVFEVKAIDETVIKMRDLEQTCHQLPSSTLIWHDTSFSSSLCRICGNPSEYLIPVFQGEGLDYQLQLKVSRYLNIEISKNDALPTQICQPCVSTLLKFHELKENCIEANTNFLKILNFEKLKTTRSLPRDIPMVDSGREPQSDVVYELESLNRNVDEISVDISLPEDILAKNKDEIRIKQVKKKKRQKLSKCSICGKVFHFVEYLKSHLLIHSDIRPHLCHICGASFKRKDHVNHHRRTVHINHPDVLKELEEKGEEPSACDDCGEIKPTRHAMFVHKKKHKISCICDVCQETFSLPSHLKAHMLKMHAEDMLPCDICGEMQKSGHAFYIHKKKHSTSYICDVCGKSFTQGSSLRTHMVIHSDEKPYSCDECGKSFKLKARLQLHKQSHGDYRPFSCNICENKHFKTKSALRVHNNMHNDSRPYPCPHCSFRARKNSDLVCHIRTHTGEKPYKCIVCGRGFAQAGDMRKHRATHEKQKSNS